MPSKKHQRHESFSAMYNYVHVFYSDRMSAALFLSELIRSPSRSFKECQVIEVNQRCNYS